MNSVKKQAKKDAHEMARAAMFYGEGAGNRRKLIAGTVNQKIHNDPNGYGVQFYRAIADEDMAEHASAARKERKKIDRHERLEKDTRAVLTGNPKNARSTVVLVALVGSAAYKAHQIGLDKRIYEEGKKVADTTVDFYKRIYKRVKERQDERRRNNIRPV